VLETRTAVVLGHGTGGVHTLERAYERFYGTKSPRPHPLTIPRAMLSAATSAITMEFGIKGPAFAISSACSSSGHSIAMGALMIKSGLVDVVIVGGSEAMASAGSMRAWESLQAISPTSCRPFSAGRDGTVIGEGAAALILESGAYARSRGARVLSELRGIGMSSDASHLTQPHAQGAIAAMTQACRGADVTGKEVLLVAAHGTGTTLNDKNEAQALREVFGDLGTAFRVIATKSGHGHLLGGSTALQAVLGLKALAAGVAPPILNYLGPDPQCDLDLVLGEAQPIRSSTLLVNSFAFGGLNTSLVFGV
jgi:nodulation protein E